MADPFIYTLPFRLNLPGQIQNHVFHFMASHTVCELKSI
jgi:hypothetical protein